MSTISGGSSFKKRVLSSLRAIGIEENTTSDLLFTKKVFAPSLSQTSTNFVLYYNPNTDEITYNSLSISTASQITVTNDFSNGNYFVPFVKSDTGPQTMYIDTTVGSSGSFTYNPSTRKLDAIVQVANTFAVSSATTSGAHYITLVKDISSPQAALIETALTYNPGTNTLTASNFNGVASSANNVNIANDTTTTMCYPVFVKNPTGNTQLYSDSTTNPLTFVPATSTLTCSTVVANLSGNAATASALSISNDNTSGSYYVPFVKADSGTQAAFVDSVTGPLTYNPATSTLSALNFSGTATVATNVNVTTDNTSSTCYPVFVKSNSSGGMQLFSDPSTNPLTYVPSTSTLKATVLEHNSLLTNGELRLQATTGGLLSASAGSNSGLHLRIFINDNAGGYTTYKIPLYNN
jgi:hypothetical protein